MRLDFNVLWVDDQPRNMSGSVGTLQRAMADEGFELKHTFCTGMDDVTARIADDIFRDEVDLILVDWNLGSGLEGQDVIARIRETVPYKDIIFYSADAKVENLKEASFNAGNEGVYFVVREDLVVEATQLFLSMIKKVVDLDHTRGIVMGATSDVDQTARECLQLAHDLLDDVGKKGVVAEMVALLSEKAPSMEKDVKKLCATPEVGAILAAHRTFTAHDGLHILSRLLKMPEFAAHKGHRESVTRYMNDIMPMRNVLGHQVLTPDGKPGIAGATSAEVISLERMRELRKTLLELRNEFKLLHGSLAGPG